MKSGVKGFWKKQKYVIYRHKSSFYPHCNTVTYASDGYFDFLHKESFDIDDLRNACSVEVKINDKKN